MGLFSRRRGETADDVAPRLAELEARLAALGDLADRVPAPLPAPADAPPRLLDADETEAAITELRVQMARVDEHLSLLDRRITSVSNELVNQITELGNEIDGLATGSATGVDDETLERLHDAQVRLADEQARYQIAFRDDLAALAARLRR